MTCVTRISWTESCRLRITASEVPVSLENLIASHCQQRVWFSDSLLAYTVASLLKLWTGAWSDRLGQREIFVVIGYALNGLSRACLGIATQISYVFGIRRWDRVDKGIRTAPRDVLITESMVESRGEFEFGLHCEVDHLDLEIAPRLVAVFN